MNESPGTPFGLVYPLWLIVSADSLIIDAARRARLTPKPKLYSTDIDGKKCVPLFTAYDLADRHAQQNGLMNVARFAIENEQRFRNELTRFTAQGFRFIVINPGRSGSSVRTAEIQALIAQLTAKA
jgi:hypothetical protein